MVLYTTTLINRKGIKKRGENGLNNLYYHSGCRGGVKVKSKKGSDYTTCIAGYALLLVIHSIQFILKTHASDKWIRILLFSSLTFKTLI
jgi:hypothetical protein